MIASSRILEREFLEVHQNENQVILQSTQEMLKNLNNQKLVQTDLQIKFKNIVSSKAGCFLDKVIFQTLF